MDFHEKLQELRKNKGLTQEELAEILYVSRTAVSKWESGKGYPNIDSLKAIAAYFSVTIDDLLSGESLLFLAEKEHRFNFIKHCRRLFGVVDISAWILLILPLYPKTVNNEVVSVSWFEYTTSSIVIYWLLGAFAMIMILCGIIQSFVGFSQDASVGRERFYRILMRVSVGSNILTVGLLALSRIAYATVVAFFLLLLKGVLIMKKIK